MSREAPPHESTLSSRPKGNASAGPVIDLLAEQPRFRYERRALSQALVFAFATGGGGDAFERTLGRVDPGPSTFDPKCFAADIFLEGFVSRCLRSAVEGAQRSFNRPALVRLLARPPASAADAQLRRGVFQELATSPRRLEACEQAWLRLDNTRDMLESSDLGKRSDVVARRLELLARFGQDFAWLQEAFSGAESALRRIAEFTQEVRASRAFAQLQQLLDYDGRLATLDLRVRVDRRGRIATLSLLEHEPNQDNPLHRGPLPRFWDRLLTFFRGYSVYEREVIGRLVEAVFDGIEPYVAQLLQLQQQLEFFLALHGLRQKAAEAGLAMSLPDWTASEVEGVRLEQLFNPFLLLEDRPPIPCDLSLSRGGLIMLTGPNSGGKTRLLQGLALTQLLGQCGAPVPARAARLCWRSGMFVSLVHESSPDQREGRLGTELLRIRHLFERLQTDQLVLLDELCSGTNPSEGEQIVELVIELLTELRPQALISTHFLQFAKRLADKPPVAGLGFLQVALDSDQKPTYQFVPGVASTSLAAQTAARLGVTRDALAALIRSKLSAPRG